MKICRTLSTKWLARIASLVAFAAVSASAAVVSLVWDVSEGSEAAYYKVYSVGTNGTNVVNAAGSSATMMVIEGEKYAFSVTAVDAEGSESDPSDSVQYTVPMGNQAPVIGLVANRIVNVGNAVEVKVTAVDPDVPTQQLTFSLGAGAPDGAEIDPFTGEFKWTPPSATTAEITVVVSDNGFPERSSEAVFTVVAGEPGAFFALRIGGFYAGKAIHSPRGTLSALGEAYSVGAKVLLSATAAAGYAITGWILNSQFVAANPIQVTMHQDVAATPIFAPLSGGSTPPAQDISMVMGLQDGQPAISVGGEMGAWALEASSNLKDWLEVAGGLTSEQLAVEATAKHAFYRVRPVQLAAMTESPLQLADISFNP